MKPCPFCRSQIQDAAIKCRFCGEMLTDVAASVVSAPAAPLVPTPSPPPGSHSLAPPTPGAPTWIPIEPKAGPIALGALLIIGSIWALVSYLPSLKISAAEQALYVANCAARGVSRCEIPTGVYPWMYIVAILVGLIGLQELISGATHRAFAEVRCRICKMKVVGKKTLMGVRCPTGNHAAVQHATKVVLLVVLTLVLILLAAS